MFNKALLYIAILLCSLNSQSQELTGFCRDGFGNKSDPISIENFGTGETIKLTQGASSYTYEEGKLTTAGSYHVSSVSEWFNEDNTPDDHDGRALIMRIGKNPGKPYNLKIEGLCPYTAYTLEFYENIYSPTECKIYHSIKYITDIYDYDGFSRSYYYGIFATGWRKRWLRFNTGTQNFVTFFIELEYGTECTYYLAIDDLTLMACGEKVLLSDRTGRNSVQICQNDFPFSTTIIASPNYSGSKQHNYQWQSSSDGINWTNIVGETRGEYTTPSISETTYFRAIVSHGNILCGNNLEYNYPSEIYVVSVIDSITPPIRKGDLTFCVGDSKVVFVTVDNGFTVDWYDAPTDGNLLLENSNVFNPEGVSGTYYAEARLYFNKNCTSSRTAVKVDYIEPPVINDETIVFCKNTNSSIHAGVTANNYLWSNGETTEGITVNEPGIYTVEMDFNGCVIKKQITLVPSEFSIESVVSDGKNIVVTTNKSGDFLFSINGNTYQSSNVFTNIEGGLYTIYVKDKNCNAPITTKFIHFYVPSFFTPNGDGIHDFFEIKGLELFNSSQVSIFNRFGKLLKSSKDSPFVWDGSYLGNKLPSDDYWYVVIVDDRKFTGHFSLKR